MYGLRTIIPISIGLTRYSAKKFAIINLFSAWIWAAITILLAYYFAQELIDMLHFAKKHWYYALPFASLILYIANKAINKFEKRLEQKRKAKI
jgi:membrane protein DedA with SNARE-associated domain